MSSRAEVVSYFSALALSLFPGQKQSVFISEGKDEMMDAIISRMASSVLIWTGYDISFRSIEGQKHRIRRCGFYLLRKKAAKETADQVFSDMEEKIVFLLKLMINDRALARQFQFTQIAVFHDVLVNEMTIAEVDNILDGRYGYYVTIPILSRL